MLCRNPNDPRAEQQASTHKWEEDRETRSRFKDIQWEKFDMSTQLYLSISKCVFINEPGPPVRAIKRDFQAVLFRGAMHSQNPCPNYSVYYVRYTAPQNCRNLATQDTHVHT